MDEYWPVAKVKEKDGTTTLLSDDKPCYSVRDGLSAIVGWSDLYNVDIIDCWIVFKNKNTQEEL